MQSAIELVVSQTIGFHGATANSDFAISALTVAMFSVAETVNKKNQTNACTRCGRMNMLEIEFWRSMRSYKCWAIFGGRLGEAILTLGSKDKQQRSGGTRTSIE
ncbi:MAG TPA: hypothetical protein PK585_00015 [Amphiplicatus sp.]|nr:hypothetical protein [Amphiplicatus sp.]MCB9956130.1 hypothetical protein [Caulobacterales bacterium]HOP18437.1 hypothetical protein [Amphiplicatus sp.]